MNDKKYLEQVHSKIKKRESLNIELRDTCIEIDAGKSVVFKIDAKGGRFYSADNRLREIVGIDEKTVFQIMDSIANAVTHRS